MEANFYFSAFVLGMTALDLLWTASGRLDRWWRKRQGPAAKKSGRTRQRNDWYVFFHCGDLVGKGADTTSRPVTPDRKTADRQRSRSPRAAAC